MLYVLSQAFCSYCKVLLCAEIAALNASQRIQEHQGDFCPTFARIHHFSARGHRIIAEKKRTFNVKHA
jgi:hypothetical protein